MLTDPKLRSQVDSLWDKFWTGGLANPLDAIEQFSPAFFDLIIFDEVHRSVFNRYSEVLQYFDSRMIGLTATPASYIDRDTFEAFDCHDDKPTYLYTYEQAIKDKYLVDYNLYAAQTRFQREGLFQSLLAKKFNS